MIYPMSRILFYRPIFIIMLIISISMFGVKLKKKNPFILRYIISILLCLEISFVFPLFSDNAFYISSMFFIFWIVVYLMMIFCLQENKKNLLFISIIGYTTEHIAYELYLFIVTVFGIVNGENGIYSFQNKFLFINYQDAICYFASYLFIYFFAYLFFARKIKGNEGIRINNPLFLIIGIIFIFIDISLNAFVDNYSKANFDKTYICTIAIINILLCIMFEFFAFETSTRQELRKNLDVISQMKYNEEKQYELSKENIALINQKCHDLKYFIRNYGNNQTLNPQVIEEISQSIEIFDSNIKTGNNALDIIFTEKSLLCYKNNIRFTCIADGKLLSFMDDVDAYSLFGNLVDNAIEALKDEAQKRVISLIIKGQGDFVSISIQNFFSKKLHFENGLPITTKKDKNYHGYGMQSIKMICEKYNGTLSINTNDNIFSVNILFLKQ